MTDVHATWVPFAEAPAELSRPGGDTRWMSAAGLVAGLTVVGVVFSFLSRSWLGEYSTSARVAIVYLPAAILIMLAIGWSPRLFPVAAGLFYAYLPISQAVNDTWFVFGDVEGAVTTEMILAAPLIIIGLLGRGDDRPHLRPLPRILVAGWVLVLLSAVISTVLAVDPSTAAWTCASRFVCPVLVTFATYRRLRGLDDFKIVSYSFILGALAISAFGFERQVEGSASVLRFATSVDQRTAGLSVSSSLPALYVMGLALWHARARAEELAVVRASIWLGVAGLMPMLFWIGGHRAPLAGAALLVLIWLPRSIRQLLARPLMLLPLAIGAAGAVYVVRYSVEKTSSDTQMILERFSELLAEGFKGHNRVEVWGIAIDGWLSSPIWGAGLNNCVVVQSTYLNLHSSLLAALFDVGLFGVAAYLLIVVPILLMNRRQLTLGLSRAQQQFYYGHLASWLLIELLLLVDLPVTSGQPKNNILVYLTMMYPLLAMKLYVHSSRRDVPLSEPGWNPGGAPPASAGYPARAGLVSDRAPTSGAPTGRS